MAINLEKELDDGSRTDDMSSKLAEMLASATKEYIGFQRRLQHGKSMLSNDTGNEVI
jgi:hypothetical protein